MKVTISIDNDKTVKVLPFVSKDAMTIDYGDSPNENKDAVKYNQIKVMGAEPLAKVSISSFFPNGMTSFAEPDSDPDPLSNIKFFRDNRKKRKLMRVVITNKKGEEVFSRRMACETFKINEVSTAGDYYYNLEFEQYRLVR